jgi:hypothetical protein
MAEPRLSRMTISTAGSEGCEEVLFDGGKEAFAVDWPVERARGVDPVVAQRRQKSGRLPEDLVIQTRFDPASSADSARARDSSAASFITSFGRDPAPGLPVLPRLVYTVFMAEESGGNR